MAIYQLGDDAPSVAPSAFVADSAAVIGRVAVGEQSSVWFAAVLRGDNEPITIGARTSIQDGAVLHTDPGSPCVVGDDVIVGHQAMLHGCTIGDGSLVGIQAVVLNGARIGKGCLVGAGAVVTEGKEFPDRSLILGAPATAVKTLTEEQVARMQLGAANYVHKTALYRRDLKKIG
ncbi:MAG: gamma carbonic anhydrase family protein [Pseudomonadota bacterium]|nr:gamma carbonic anhydrase family protein [Rubrivivax sp.]MCA3257213.1 gamma carbonic anhydrase family protein [Rubrivivax sp.]MCE2912248.1 gamma carbonic anhydrase family protein [Rubrivivax sp.]MCZ8032668.1 gamma carbonic anhydrase family protein [Rubrivivax sp.]